METAERPSLAGVLGAVVAGSLVGWAGSQGGPAWAGVPVVALAVALAFGLQWVAFLPSYLARTERWFDLVGSLTFVVLTLLVLALTPQADARAYLLAAVVVTWAWCGWASP